ncbi:uncharacterized protein TOT_020000323 [Theileria orientalis strain Shintoku]|uniref:Uncharacterized protein n=1 Tax=Theileria orientalis strain Shintoku TaxID=869250 RepID=J4C396_THEOR|nr:uncharacterized protein TOT_020000323 [Theileria orientalis strain Shintoku]BAM40056.1 uncharacterized protein TOT_020000323 [Theileria orientalis strain Shintoku]|eukprot:XP_009690357.1 uncharacterized protein TOT_020000323 [Theileria orientalis strain Shintoku]
MQTHNTLIWVIVYLVSNGPQNLITCRTVPAGVEAYVRDPVEPSRECEPKQPDSSSHEKLVSDSCSYISQGPKKPIILDINFHFSTDLYDLYNIGDYYSYISKNGNLFGKIREDGKVLWDPGPSEYATKVNVSGGDKVSILLENGTKKVFKRADKHWLEAGEDEFEDDKQNFGDNARCICVDSEGSKALKPKQGHYRKSIPLNGNDASVVAENGGNERPANTNQDLTDPFNLEIFSAGSSGSNDPSKNHFVRVEPREAYYIFKQGVNCDRVKVNGDLIWEHNVLDTQGTYPKSVIYYKESQLSIIFKDDIMLFGKLGCKWTPKNRLKNRATCEDGSGLSCHQPGVEGLTKSADLCAHSISSLSETCCQGTLNYNNNNIARRNANNNSLGLSTPHLSRRASTSTLGSDASLVKLSPIELDVKNTDSTDTFTCIKKDGFAKYTAKEGYGFSSVKKTGGTFSRTVEEVWNSPDPKHCATTVVRDGAGGSNMSNVTLFFDANYKHFKKSDTSYFLDSDIRLFEVDPTDTTKTKQLPSSQYTRSYEEDVFKFEFKNEVKCSEVKYMHRRLEGDQSSKVVVSLEQVWNHDSTKHGDQYPKVLKYYWPDKLLINFEHISIIHTKSSQGKWDDGFMFEVRMYAKDSKGVMKELDASAYGITSKDDEQTFTFKRDVNCEMVKIKGVEVWKHSSDKQGDNASILYVDFDTFFVMSKRKADNTWKSNEFMIKFYRADPKDENEVVELTPSSFTIEEDPQGFDIKMNEGVKCTLIKSDTKILWKHGHATDTENHPSVVRYCQKNVLVHLADSIFLCEKDDSNNWKKFDFPFKMYKRDPNVYSNFLELTGSDYNLVHQGDNYKFSIKKTANVALVKMDGQELWKYDAYIGQCPRPTALIYAKNKKKFSLDYENFFTIYKKESDGSWDKGQIIDMKLYTQDPNDPEKFLTITDNHYKLNDQIEEFVFELKDNVKCALVKLSGDEVWKYDQVLHSGKYPKRFVYKRHKMMVALVFEEFYVLIEKGKGSELWVPKESTPLDLSQATPTHKYIYEVHELFSIYVPTEEFVFAQVKMNDDVIYEPINPCDLAAKVLVYKTSSNIDVVDLYLPGGIIKRYGRSQDGTWYEKLTTLSLDLKMEGSGSYFKCTGRNTGSYVTKKSFGFNKIVFGSWDIWEADNERDYAFKVDVNELEDSFLVKVYLKAGVMKEFNVQKINRQKLLDVPTPSHSGSDASSHHVSLL